MVNYQTVSNCLFNVVGWQNTFATDEGFVDDRFNNPTSGMFYNLNSDIINLTKMKALAPNTAGFDYPFDLFTAYDVGDRVVYEGLLYEANTTVTGQNPSLSPSFDKIDVFSEFLENFTKTVCFDLADAIATRKETNKQAKSLLNDAPLYNNNANFRKVSNFVANTGRFVALKISVKEYRDLDMRIKKLVLQFTQPQTQLPIYVFHTSQRQAITTFNVTTDKSYSACVIDINDILLNYNSDEYTQGGCFYIGYYQEDVTGNAINDKNFKCNRPCSCNPSAYKAWNEMNKFLTFSSVYVNQENYTKLEMWDTDLEVSDCNSYGLNIRLSVECSLNGFICENSQMFSQALISQAEINFTELVMNTDRTNELDSRLLSHATVNLQADAFDLKAKLNEQIDAMDFNISDLNSPCAPKKKRRVWSQSV